MSGAPSTSAPAVSIVIPVKNAARWLPDLLPALFAQDPAPMEVVLVDSMSTDATREIAARFDRVRVVPIENFSHGRARNLGAREARGEFVVLLTQDALPDGPAWLARLLAPLLEDPQVAAAYSRQAPRPDANPMERYFLLTHFPDGPAVRRAKQPGETLTLGKVFFSNVSGVARRELLLKHPFDENLIMSEDQQFSRDLMNAGYAVVYQPSSVVLHSHNYSLATCFKRYFDSVYSLTLIFPAHDVGTSVSMGWKYLFGEMSFIARRYPWWLPYYLLYTFAKTCGTVLAHFGDRLPRSVLRRISLHSYHWAGDPATGE